MNEIILILSFFLSLLLTLYGTPVIQKVAHRYNLLDVPDGVLKNHGKPIPYMGGVIIYFAFISPVGLLFPFSQELLGILFASSILLIVGLFDDLKALSPSIKFFFQIIATYILIKSGIRIQLQFLSPWLNTLLSFIWIITVINAMNIIDIMDGLAATIGVLATISIFIISLYNDNFVISILSISIVASLLGFLKYNWEPARIYLGDAGSMFLGLVIGALTIMGDYTRYNNMAFISGLLILSIPLFDTLYVIILRLFHGKSPFFGSPDHFCLRLKKKFGLTAAKTVAVTGFIQLLLSVVIIINFYTTPVVTFITSGAILLFFIGFGIFLASEKME